MTRYRSKPQYVEAISWDGSAARRMEIMALGGFIENDGRGGAILWAGKNGSQGWVPVPVGHWVVTDGSGADFWPVAHDYFVAKYEPAEENP